MIFCISLYQLSLSFWIRLFHIWLHLWSRIFLASTAPIAWYSVLLLLLQLFVQYLCYLGEEKIDLCLVALGVCYLTKKNKKLGGFLKHLCGVHQNFKEEWLASVGRWYWFWFMIFNFLVPAKQKNIIPTFHFPWKIFPQKTFSRKVWFSSKQTSLREPKINVNYSSTDFKQDFIGSMIED